MKFTRTLLVTSVMLGLSACGGGGSDGDSNNEGSGNVSTTPVVITEENGRQIAASGASGALSAGDATRDAADFDDSITSEHVVPSVKNVVRLALSKSDDFSSRAKSSVTNDCDSGSVTMTVNDANNNEELDSGDSIEMTFNNCSDSDYDGGTTTMSGSTTITFTNIDLMGENMDVKIEFDDLTTVDATDTVSMDGDIRLVSTVSNDLSSSRVSGDKIEARVNDDFVLVRDFDMEQTWNEINNEWTQSTDAKYASSEFDGQVTIDTIRALQGTGDNPPYTGEMRIEGADNTFVALDADTGNLNTVFVTINDGPTQELTWEEL